MNYKNPKDQEINLPRARDFKLLKEISPELKEAMEALRLKEEVKRERGNSKKILEFLRNNSLPESSRRSAEEIEATVEELRNSWD